MVTLERTIARKVLLGNQMNMLWLSSNNKKVQPINCSLMNSNKNQSKRSMPWPELWVDWLARKAASTVTRTIKEAHRQLSYRKKARGHGRMISKDLGASVCLDIFDLKPACQRRSKPCLSRKFKIRSKGRRTQVPTLDSYKKIRRFSCRFQKSIRNERSRSMTSSKPKGKRYMKNKMMKSRRPKSRQS